MAAPFTLDQLFTAPDFFERQHIKLVAIVDTCMQSSKCLVSCIKALQPVEYSCLVEGNHSAPKMLLDLNPILLGCVDPQHKLLQRLAIFRQQAKAKAHTLFVVVQGDLHGLEIIEQILCLSDLVLHVLPAESTATDESFVLFNSPCILRVQLSQRLPGAKLKEEECVLSIVNGSPIASMPTSPYNPVKGISDSHSAAATLTSSFNLGLTLSQRNAKDSLVLPYTRSADQVHTHDSTVQGSRPILAEDFDNEDPDADLEF